ncbi:MAG: DEAD/DEAH box helicase family protein [Candidatus Eisenbacteria sp.]|nr:DEAD/DEAH box helicase family protein [Candidatus Eisenbacteria bacterium]
MLELRPYQHEAVAAIYRHLRERDDNPCVVIPTGGGKTPVMATVCRDAVGRWNGRVLILAHVKELLEQALEKIHLVAPEMWVKTGIYSAGLKRRDTEHPIIIAGIQSVYRRACELDAFDIVIIDEAHMIPPDGEGMYRTFLEDARKVNPNLRVIGLTATPFRMKSGMICAPENVLNHICNQIGVKELIVQGYLCPLITKGSRLTIDTSGLHIRAGEFVAGEAEDLMDTDKLVESACQEIVEQTHARRSVLIFTTGIGHGRHVAEAMRRKTGEAVETVFGETAGLERDRVLQDFKAGRLKYLVNVNVLTLGFDAPNIDCVAMVRPTMSPGLYYQMVGRGFRLCDGKENCLILDFGGNVLRHGPVDAIRLQTVDYWGNGDAPAKQCPACRSVVAAGYSTCPDCGYEFPPRERQGHDAKACTEGILSSEVTTTEYPVQGVSYTVHHKRGAPDDAPRTLRVDYRIGFNQYQSEWICFEHTGWARHKAESWWCRRSDVPVPDSAAQAEALANAGAIRETRSITVRSAVGEKYDRIVGYELGARPQRREPGDDWDELPSAECYDYAEDGGLPF